MSQSRTTICDVCGRQKGEANHWLIAVSRPDRHGIAFGPAAVRELLPEDGVVVEDICGDSCAQTCLSQFLTSLKSPALKEQA